MIRLPIVLLFLALPVSMFASPKPTPRAAREAPAAAFDRATYAIPHTSFVLDNGLTVIVHEDHSTPIVAVNLWYHVGSRNEKRGKTGFAHLFEHFFFNGSENYRHGFREAMDDLGANNRNGTTSQDRTNFFEDVPVSGLERTLYLEADRMGFLAGNLSEEMLVRERGVVQNEKRQGENQPYGRVFGRILETIYPWSHPYSWSPIGSLDDLNAASLDDVREWYETYYGPNNCVLAIAGDITVERARELVKKYFDGIPPGPPLARTEQWIPKLDRNIRDTMEDRVPQSRIYRVYHAPGWREPAVQHLAALAEVLSGSKSARLDRILLYEKELVTAVSASVWERELASNFLITATVKQGVDVATVEREIDAIVDELIRNGPTAAELQRARSRSLAAFARRIERLGGFGGRSDVLAESMTFGGHPEAYLDRLETFATASAADIRSTARTWLDTHHYTMVVTPVPNLSAGKTDVDRSILPPLGPAPDVAFPAIQRTTLANGLEVMLLERHGAPIVNLTLVVDAGFASDPPSKAGLASLALDVMQEGTTSRDPFAIVDELDSVGARITSGSTLDQSFLRLQAMPGSLRKALDVFADVVQRPSFPPDLVALSIQRRLSRIAQENAEPVTAARRLVPRLLYGPNHPYGAPFTGSGHVATVRSLTREDLSSWHRTWFLPNNGTLVVTGDITMERLVPELERAFSTWKQGEPGRKNVEPVARTAGRKVYLIDKPNAPQSVIVAAHVSEPGGLAEDLAIETVIRNFGGMATSRLNRNLRLDKHWSYGTSGSVAEARGQRSFLVVAPVQTDRTRDAILEVIREIRGVAGERPISGAEYESLMRSQTMRLPGAFETLASLEGAAMRIINLGYPDDYFANYATNVRRLTADALNQAAAKVVRPDEVIWVVIGDLARIEGGIRELDLGEVVRIETAEP